MTRLMAPAPCGKCPWRRDVPIYLRVDRRREIVHSTMVEGMDFHCHETTTAIEGDDGETEMVAGAGALICAGMAKAINNAGGSTQGMRFAERVQRLDESAYERGAAVWTLDEFQTLPEGAHIDDWGDLIGGPEGEPEEVETCNTCDPGCLAPAGYRGAGGGVVRGTEAADDECVECGEACCSACIGEDGRCGNCAAWDDEED